MKLKRILSVIDLHSEGEPAWVDVGGILGITGNTFKDRWQWVKKNLDKLHAVKARPTRLYRENHL